MTSFRPPIQPEWVPVELLVQLGAGQDGLITVDDDDVVAAIDVRGENDFVFAAQQNSCLGGNAAQRLASGIQDIPLALDLAGFANVVLISCSSRMISFKKSDLPAKRAENTFLKAARVIITACHRLVNKKI